VQLPAALRVYTTHQIRIEANHFEEQSYLKYQDDYDEIFQGLVYPEFFIPKQ